jgi:NAD(P)-dependent dehydrogenase (short-subunit alcohol dehydrogenase family)|tara:strand:- start:141 stop:836 length:696 start_codon:yes stop_codon:yes gene_type:complete
MKNLVITGASSGIGQATAAAFKSAGYNVINLSRTPCPEAGVISIACDLSQPNFLQQISAQLEEQLGGVGEAVLIHNAALLANDSVSTTDSNEFRRILEINLVAPNSLNQMLIPLMSKGSSILYVGSTLGEKAVPNSFSYVTSKHASIGMMRATCQDLAGTGIHTACINPGFTDTEMLRAHVPADVMPQIAAMSAFERLIQPEEIAQTLLFAAQSPVLNGASINANLGQIER